MSRSFAQSTPAITWGTPPPITFGEPLSGVQLNATANTASTTIVPLSGYYNINGITTTGTPSVNGGYDGQGYAYASAMLGSSITWGGVSYPLGQPNVSDAVSNITIPLPAGEFASLVMLGSIVNNFDNSHPPPTFIVTYTDGTIQKIVQGLSDWVYPLNYPNESVAECNSARNQADGTLETFSVCVYAYQLSLISTKTVQSLTLPATRDVVMLAMGLVAPAVPGNWDYSPALGTQLPAGTNTLSVQFMPADLSSYTTTSATVQLFVNQATPTIVWPSPAPVNYGTPLSSTQLDATPTATTGQVIVPLSSQYNVNAFYPDIVSFQVRSFNNDKEAYSATELGESTTWNGINFPFGPAGAPDAVTSTTISLPAGEFMSLSLLGAAASNSAQPNQPFVVTYTTGAPGPVQLSLSSWTQSSSYPGEAVVASTDHANNSDGSESPGTYDVYGYQIPLDPARTVQSITLPNNRDVVIFAMALSSSSAATNPVPGDSTYTPGFGATTLPRGTNPLSVSFTPADTTDYTDVTGTTSIVINQQPLTVTANNQTSAFGRPISPYTYTITGFVNGDTQANAVTGSPSLTTNPATPVSLGTYPILPTIGSLSSANYSFSNFVPGFLSIVSQNFLTVSANSFTRLYGILNPTLTGTITGEQNGDAFTESFFTAAGILSQPGKYAIAPSASGTNIANYVQVVQNGTLTVTQAPVVTTISLSSSSVFYGSNVTITTNVVSTTTGIPTGTVSLFDNGNLLGSAVLANGAATYSTTSLAPGTNVIFAVYSGDINFSGSTASATSGTSTITIQPLDFTLQLTSQPTVQGTYGADRQFTLHLSPIGGSYPDTVQFSVGGNGPIAATYTFSPATVDKNDGPVDVTLTVSTKKLASLESPNKWPDKLSSIAFSLFLLPLLGVGYSRRTNRRLTRAISYLFLILLSAGAIETMTGCGSGYFNFDYPITVTATSNGVQHSVSVNFQIMQSPQ